MQYLLTLAFDAIAATAVLWFISTFASYAWQRSASNHEKLAEPTPPGTDIPALPDPWTTDPAPAKPQPQPKPNSQTILYLLPPAREVAEQPTLAQLNIRDLRKHCNQIGLKWRNANGKNKHLSRTQILERLAATT